MLRVLFLGEGTSDEGIALHVERIAAECGVDVAITVPRLEFVPGYLDRSVAGKLLGIRRMGGTYDVVVVHRDGDRDGRDARLKEIRAAVEEVMPDVNHVCVIPIRMTEAWLVLDESAIREVAGNPNGREILGVPEPAIAEKIPDPKALLKELLVKASGLTGRRLRDFRTKFPVHRRLLLERLRPNGPVTRLTAWQQFDEDVRSVFGNGQ
jgi:hypothetical protein